MGKCRCGYESYTVFHTFGVLRKDLESRQEKWKIAEELERIKSHLPLMEEACGLDLKEEKKKIDRAKEKLSKLSYSVNVEKDWEEIEKTVKSADFWAMNKLLECAEKEKS